MIEMPSAGSTIGSRGLEAPVLRESLLKQTTQPQSAIAATARYLARSEGEADLGWDGVAVALGVE